MDVIVEKAAGLDVHQETVVACVVWTGADGKLRKEVRTFPTFTAGLLELREWLLSRGCTHVGMESTGVYWKPVYYALEDSGLELIVGNAQHMKNVPGRKTDVKDSEWIAKLIRVGAVAKSFVPPPPIRELRDLLRYRTKLVQARTSERNRLQGLLETANIKLGSVASDIFGVSGMRMLRAIVAGEANAATLASLAVGRLRPKRRELQLALDGRIQEHHRFILQMQLDRLDGIDKDLARLDERVDAKLEPYREEHERLVQIPGVERVVAASIIAELGVDMSVFKTAQHVASWAGVCPGNNESAGRRRKGKTRKGNVHLRTMLVQAATASGRTKGTYLKDKYHRLKARRGVGRAQLAIAHKILVTAYYMLARKAAYHELGDSFLDQQSHARVAKACVRRLERLGYAVALEKKAA